MSLSRFNHCKARWSVWILNGRPNRYTLKALTASRMAKHSFSTVEYFCSRGNSFRLKYAMGWSLPASSHWLSTAPTPRSEASVWTTKGTEKFGLQSTGVWQRRCFNSLCHSVHSIALDSGWPSSSCQSMVLQSRHTLG